PGPEPGNPQSARSRIPGSPAFAPRNEKETSSYLERVLHKDGILALRAGGEHGHRTADQLLDSPHVFYGLRRQLRPGAGPRCGLLPAVDRLVDRLDAGLGEFARRQIVDDAAVEPVAGADLDRVEAVEDVELGERQAVDAAGAHGLAHQHGVEPAAAAGPPGDGAELAAALAERLADVVLLLGRERPLPDPRGVGLADAEHVIDGVGPEP